jgi:hypothetical protein
MSQCPPGPQVVHWGLFEFFRKFAGRELMFITGVHDTGDKLFSSVNDTGEKFIAGVVNTGEQFIFPRCVDTVKKKTKKPKMFRWCQRHR